MDMPRNDRRFDALSLWRFKVEVDMILDAYFPATAGGDYFAAEDYQAYRTRGLAPDAAARVMLEEHYFGTA